MAKLVYPEAKYLKEIIDSLSKLTDEAAFQLTSGGLKIVALDPARVALININVPQTAFLEYDVPEETIVGLSMASLSRMLRKVKKGDRFVLNTRDDRVEVVVESIGKRIYRFRNLEARLPEIQELRLEFSVVAQLLVDVVKQLIRDAEAVGDLVELEAPDSETLYLRGRGASVVETKLTLGTPALVSLEVRRPSKSAYQLEYLRHVVNLAKISDLVTLKFSSDSPLELEFSLGESRVKYLLASTTSA